MDVDLSDGDFLDLFDLKDFKEDIELEIEISDSAILRLSSTEGSREFASDFCLNLSLLASLD